MHQKCQAPQRSIPPCKGCRSDVASPSPTPQHWTAAGGEALAEHTGDLVYTRARGRRSQPRPGFAAADDDDDDVGLSFPLGCAAIPQAPQGRHVGDARDGQLRVRSWGQSRRRPPRCAWGRSAGFFRVSPECGTSWRAWAGLRDKGWPHGWVMTPPSQDIRGRYLRRSLFGSLREWLHAVVCS